MIGPGYLLQGSGVEIGSLASTFTAPSKIVRERHSFRESTPLSTKSHNGTQPPPSELKLRGGKHGDGAANGGHALRRTSGRDREYPEVELKITVVTMRRRFVRKAWDQ